MIFLKPLWVNHGDSKPIFSVDIHPQGGRFATGGQGVSGGKIVIWNLNPVIDGREEENAQVHKMLCQMDNHLACVNVVRWSNSGHLLASGGDDKLVMIWRLTNEGSSSVFGSRQVNVETWKCVHTLNSHNGDVLDLAWAPHDGWLASSSVDNSVIIWNAHKFPEKVAVLKSHTGMVKGVTWDPVGKYLASQSDDKTLRIWRTSDWVQEELVTDPFVECSATTHVLRLSWSPDGQYLVSAHAMNGGGPTAQIIEREGWRQDKDFVGHRKAVTCVRFNSNILKKKIAKGSPKTQQYCCCAIGSRDRSISVWLTSLKRPLVVIKDLFDDSVLDISWSSNGLFLLACSWDGTVACIVFSHDELGMPLTMDEKNVLYEKMYHKSLQRNWNLSFVGTQIAENPELLSAMEEINEKNAAKPQPEIPETNLNISHNTTFETPQVNQSVLVPVNKQVETRLPSGKRRITPMFLTSVPNNSTSVPPAANSDGDVTFSNDSNAFSKSSPVKSQIVIETVKEQVKPRLKMDTNFRKDVQKVAMNAPAPQITQLMCSEVPGDEPIVKLISILDPLKMPPGTTATKDVGVLKIQVTNKCIKTHTGFLTRIEVYKKSDEKQPLWETYLGSTIRCIAANQTRLIACCEDLSINCYNLQNGSRMLPPLLVEDMVSSISLSQTNYCLILTKTGLMHMWDLSNCKSILNRISVRSLLTPKATICGCSLNSHNKPVITLSDGKVYSFCTDLHTWVLLSNPLDPISATGGAMTRGVQSNLPLASLQRAMPSYRINDSLPPGVSLSFLETQITATIVLQSSSEYRHWLFAAVNHLLDKGPECRLRTILDDLMGPTHSSSKKRKLDSDGDRVLGLNKKNLLTEILEIIKTKLPWQRLYKEYSEQLKLLD